MLKAIPLLSLSGLCLFTSAAMAEAPTAEQNCQTNLSRFVGLQNHVAQEGSTTVPGFAVGLSKAEIEQLVNESGYCHAWQVLQQALQQQHSAILDATEQKTGQPSPIR